MFPKYLLLLFIKVVFNTSYFFQMGQISCLIPISHRKQSTNNQAKQPRGSVNLGSQLAPLAELGALKLPPGGGSLCPGGTRAPGPGLLGNSFLCLRSPAWLCVLPKACSVLTHPSVLGTLGCPCSLKAP